MSIPSNVQLFPVAFSFLVKVTGVSGTYEGSFQEVTGLNAKIGLEELKEGGENRFVHRLPTPPKYDNLVLKRGMVLNSELITWAKDAIENFNFTTKSVLVSLLDENLKPLATWSYVNAYPVAIKISDLKAQDNSIACESIELAYDYFQRVL
jgi:phage tail-like protein